MYCHSLVCWNRLHLYYLDWLNMDINIITFSYGRRNNREAKLKVNCKKLKVPWFYIEYDNLSMRKTFLVKYLNFIKYSDTLTSVCFCKIISY